MPWHDLKKIFGGAIKRSLEELLQKSRLKKKKKSAPSAKYNGGLMSFKPKVGSPISMAEAELHNLSVVWFKKWVASYLFKIADMFEMVKNYTD